MSKDNVFILLEAKEHMISEDTKKTKFVFLFSCMVTIALCLFHKAEMMALFGLIRFSSESKIPLITLIIPSLIISFYQFKLYIHYYEESISQWKNKKNNSNKDNDGNEKEKTIFKQSFIEFNELTDNFHSLSSQVNSMPPQSPQIQFESQISKLNNELTAFLTIVNSNREEHTTWSEGEYFDSNCEKLRGDMLQRIEKIERCFKDLLKGVNDNYISNSNALTQLGDLKTFVNNSYYSKTLIASSSQLNAFCLDTQQLLHCLQNKYNQLHSEFVEDHNKRRKTLNDKWNECIERREVVINYIKMNSIDENSNKLLFQWVPFIVFYSTSILSIYVTLNNLDLLISSYKSLDFFAQ